LARLLGDLGAIITLLVVGLAGVALVSGISREQVAGWLAREPKPSTGAEPAGRAVDGRPVRINPGREKTAAPEGSAQLRLIPENDTAKSHPSATTSKPDQAPVREKTKRGKKEVPPPIFIATDPPAAP